MEEESSVSDRPISVSDRPQRPPPPPRQATGRPGAPRPAQQNGEARPPQQQRAPSASRLPPQQHQYAPQKQYANGDGRPIPQRPPSSRPPRDVEIRSAGVKGSDASGISDVRPGLENASGSIGKSGKSLTGTARDRHDEWVEINDDVYNMFFLSKVCGQAFWYGIYIFILKLTLYTFLILDALDIEQPKNVSEQVLVTQFFMLPVAVAMQDDLIATYFLLANIKYSPLIKMQNPDASKWKFHVANLCRGVDGMFSLFVNFVILIKATEVLSLFLNFAALQFLQTIDNIALRLCADGYLSERLEDVASAVITTKLPNKNNQVYRSLDSILFLSTFSALLIAWAVISFA